MYTLIFSKYKYTSLHVRCKKKKKKERNEGKSRHIFFNLQCDIVTNQI